MERWIFNRHCEPVRTLVWQSVFPFSTHISFAKRFGERIAIPQGHFRWARRTSAPRNDVENRRHYRYLGTAARRGEGISRAAGKNVNPKQKTKRAATPLAARLMCYSTLLTTPKNSGEPSFAVMRYKNGRLRFISTTGSSSPPPPVSIPPME